MKPTEYAVMYLVNNVTLKGIQVVLDVKRLNISKVLRIPILVTPLVKHVLLDV